MARIAGDHRCGAGRKSGCKEMVVIRIGAYTWKICGIDMDHMRPGNLEVGESGSHLSHGQVQFWTGEDRLVLVKGLWGSPPA